MIDPIEVNLFDLPDYEDIQDERFLPLPPPDSPGGDAEASLGNGEPEGNKSSQSKDSSGAARRAVKRPLPKLDAQRLISERGLPALRSMFDNIKFKGKGHEEADLQTLIRHMEHWAHRLFPKLQFEDFVDRVERLGNKKPVQACLKRIRLDLPILHEDFTTNEGEEAGNNRLDVATEELDVFSEIQNTREGCSSPVNTKLTEEQQERIERNRQLALERRQAKMQLDSQSQEHELPVTQPSEECEGQEPESVATLETENVPFQTSTKMQTESMEDDK
ncbi:TIMELESS-interacting protein isoform X1 [Sceloporus undulatus]|nr:TIMELESS-interacting protein isoform X1 [Sceloporus undulatus]XP_042330913.1 TIMELESS-interacting protein isoform X1 [Sceloporus undulatus]XP_042330914.1 TIMELESS-interacting protein isoform X1 [Sceloporus undulatus]XP_042330915.1 TIMELESS-interacting protein isoform X1 [Sceloporus undulatus]